MEKLMLYFSVFSVQMQVHMIMELQMSEIQKLSEQANRTKNYDKLHRFDPSFDCFAAAGDDTSNESSKMLEARRQVRALLRFLAASNSTIDPARIKRGRLKHLDGSNISDDLYVAGEDLKSLLENLERYVQGGGQDCSGYEYQKCQRHSEILQVVQAYYSARNQNVPGLLAFMLKSGKKYLLPSNDLVNPNRRLMLERLLTDKAGETDVCPRNTQRFADERAIRHTVEFLKAQAAPPESQKYSAPQPNPNLKPVCILTPRPNKKPRTVAQE